MEDALEARLKEVQNITDIKPIPHKRLARIQNSAESLNSILDTIKSDEADASALIGELGTENRYLRQANVIVQEANILDERNNASTNKLKNLEKILEDIQETVHEQNRRVVKISNQLSQFTYDIERHGPASQVESLVGEAQILLNATKERDVDIEKR